jgi:Arc/MetJ family transcription regulator
LTHADDSSILICMRTTLNIDDALLAEARRATGIESKTKVIEHALKAVIQHAARKRLASLHGAIPNASAPERRRTPRKTA